MSVVVVATISPAVEHHADVVTAYAEIAADVHAEDGCELYALHEGEERLVVIEKWASSEALKAHGSSRTMLAVREQVSGWVVAPTDVQVLQAWPAGEPDRGRL